MKKPFPPDTPYDNHDDLLTLQEMKANAEALQALGAEIVALSEKQLYRVPMDADLLASVKEARRLVDPEGKRRQMQFVGRLMRSADAEAIRKALADIKAGVPPVHAQQAATWAERMLTEGPSAIEAFLQEVPTAERQRLSQLVRQASKDLKAQKPPRARQTLVELLEELLKPV